MGLEERVQNGLITEGLENEDHHHQDHREAQVNGEALPAKRGFRRRAFPPLEAENVHAEGSGQAGQSRIGSGVSGRNKAHHEDHANVG